MKNTTRATSTVAVLALGLLLGGCAIKAPPYQPSIDNVQSLKQAPRAMRLGLFSVNAKAAGAESIGLRGTGMASPVGGDYAAYLAEALRQELVMAGKLDAQSKIEISGMLLKNDIDATGFSTAQGEIEARFVVRNDGQIRYDRVKHAKLAWESSFAGAVAIPKAQQQYPLMVQALLAQLLADSEFRTAIK